MKTNDENQFLRVLGSSDECLPLTQLLAEMQGECGSEAQANAEKHVAGCSHCETELALFRQFNSPEIRVEERADIQAIVARLRRDSPVPAPVPNWKRLWRPGLLAPAAIAFAAALVAIAVFVPRSHELPLGSFAGDSTLRSLRVEALAPIGTVKDIPEVLAWSAVKGARSYRVRVFEVDNTQLWEVAVQTNSVRLPDPVRKQVLPLKKLNWGVTALDEASRNIGDSGTQSFMLQRTLAP